MTPVKGEGLGGRKVSWVNDPQRYILMYEPPARRDTVYFYHWHLRRGPSETGPCDKSYEPLCRDKQRFISPILFVDGHVARHDFTKSIQANPQHCCEPTKDWIWYQPAPETK